MLSNGIKLLQIVLNCFYYNFIRWDWYDVVRSKWEWYDVVRSRRYQIRLILVSISNNWQCKTTKYKQIWKMMPTISGKNNFHSLQLKHQGRIAGYLKAPRSAAAVHRRQTGFGLGVFRPTPPQRANLVLPEIVKCCWPLIATSGL